jgi:DNA-binding CsgD family transcriptional regulator/catechol 2,3-dioxygenase-like lactoylglutathione lyase family enzyme
MAKTGRPPHDDVLTPAEWRVCEGVRHGLTNRQIAAKLGISLNAIKYHVANSLQKLGLVSRKELQRWNGIRKTSLLFGRTTAMNQANSVGPIGQISRNVSNIQAAERWYRDVLGLKHLYTFGNLSFFDCDGLRLFLSESEVAGQESILYFNVGDIHTACDALQSAGVTFINAPHLIHIHADGTEEWMVFFNDNDGRPLALMSRVNPA